MLYKGAIFQAWNKKQAVVLHRAFYDTLPELPEVARNEADVAWLVYDFEFIREQNRYQLVPDKTIYTKFDPALQEITTPKAGSVKEFVRELQTKLDEKFENNYPPDAPTLADIIQQ